MAKPSKASPTRTAIRDSIIAQMFGAILPTLMRQGGISALLIISLIGRDAEFQIGLAFLVMQWAMLFRLLAAPYVDTAWRRRFLVRWIAGSAVCAALLLVVPVSAEFWDPGGAVWLLLGILAAFFVTMHIGAAAWFPLLSFILPPSLMGRYFGYMRRAWQVASYGAVFLSGLLLGGEPSLYRFYLVLVPAVLLQFGRVFMYARLPDPPPAKTEREGPVWSELARPLVDRGFRPFLIYVAMISVVQHAAVPFIVPFLKSELGFPTSVTLYGTAFFGLGSVLSLVSWGRLADRLGNRVTLLLSLVVTAAALGILALLPHYGAGGAAAMAVAVVGLVLTGVGTAGTGIAYTVRLMHLAPEEHSGPYLNVVQATFGVSGGLTAAIAGFALTRLPEQVALGDASVLTFRLFFAVVALATLALTYGVRRLTPVSERGLQQIVTDLSQGLPSPFSAPMVLLRKVMRK